MQARAAGSRDQAATRRPHSVDPIRDLETPTVRGTGHAPPDFAKRSGPIASRARVEPIGAPRVAARCACGGGCPRCSANTGTAGAASRTRTPAIGARDDAREREADSMADHALRHAVAPSRAAAAAPLHDARSSAAVDGPPAPHLVDEALAAPGQALDGATRAFFEPRFGQSLGAVRVHTGRVAADSARAVDSRAYAVGSDLVFGDGQYAPGSDRGRRLLAHELAHTVQAGASPGVLRRAPPDSPDAPLKEAKKEDATGAVEGGLKTVADAAGKDDKLKNFGLDLAKQYALPVWNGASDGDKAAAVVGAAAIYGTGIAALASNSAGRDKLSGVNFIAPLGLIPYATLTGFSFDTPKSKTEPFLLHFSLKGDDLLDLAHQKLSFVPPLSLSFDMTLSVAPDGKVSTPFALAKFGVLPGVSVSAGYGVATDLPKLDSPGAGQPLAPYKEFPQPALPASPAGAAVFVGVDLTKAPILPEAVRRVLGGDTGAKK